MAFPPIGKIDLGDYSSRVRQASPDCRVILPERFRTYDLRGGFSL
jgi:hypothetical protein